MMSTSSRNVISWPIYPLLIGLYLPLHFFSNNTSLFNFGQTWRALAAFSLFAALIFIIFWLALRRLHLVAFISGIVLVAVALALKNPIHQLLVVAVALVLGAIAFWKDVAPGWSAFLNVLALAVLLQPMLTIANRYLLLPDTGTLESSPFNNVGPSLAGDVETPVLVHMVLDGYSSNAALEKLYNFDNGLFTNTLSDLGFVVFEKARSPYNQTLFIMSSIFGGMYLEPGEGPLSISNQDHLRSALGGIVSQGPVQQRLAEKDYEFLFVDSGYEFFSFPDYAIVSTPDVPRKSLNFFEIGLLQNFGVLIDSEPAKNYNEFLRHGLTTDFYNEAKPPYMLYEHLLAPHPPFVIDRDGNTDIRSKYFNTLGDANHATDNNPQLVQLYRNGYLEKLLYTNKAALKQVSKMIADIEGSKIIIIHGDHGSGASHNYDSQQLDSCLSERFSPFLAVYSDNPKLQKKLASIAADEFNLVNLYRVIFDETFGTELGQLESRSFFVPWDQPQQPQLLDQAQLDLNSC
jgi:hypothetical protein